MTTKLTTNLTLTGSQRPAPARGCSSLGALPSDGGGTRSRAWRLVDQPRGSHGWRQVHCSLSIIRASFSEDAWLGSVPENPVFPRGGYVESDR